MSHQENKDQGLKRMALSLMRAVKEAHRLLDPGGERVLRANLVMRSGQGGSIEVELPATNMLDFVVERIRLTFIESGDEHDQKLVIVLNGWIPDRFRHACLMLSSEADVKAFMALMRMHGSEDIRPQGFLQGRVAPKAFLFDTPDPQTERHQLMFTDTGDFMSSTSEPRDPASREA